MRPNDAIYSIIFMILVLLLLFAILTQNQPSLQQQSSQLSPIPSSAYPDKIKLKNKSLINDISEQVVRKQHLNQLMFGYKHLKIEYMLNVTNQHIS